MSCQRQQPQYLRVLTKYTHRLPILAKKKSKKYNQWNQESIERKKHNNKVLRTKKNILYFFTHFFCYFLEPFARVSFLPVSAHPRSFLCFLASVFVSQSNPNRDQSSHAGTGSVMRTTISLPLFTAILQLPRITWASFRLLFFLVKQWQVAAAFCQTV